MQSEKEKLLKLVSIMADKQPVILRNLFNLSAKFDEDEFFQETVFDDFDKSYIVVCLLEKERVFSISPERKLLNDWDKGGTTAFLWWMNKIKYMLLDSDIIVTSIKYII